MRTRKSNPEGLPARVYFVSGAYRYRAPITNKWHTLGKVWNFAAKSKWAEISGEAPPEGTVGELMALYRRDVVPLKARRTQLDNLGELDRLEKVFGQMRAKDVRLAGVAKYLEMRGRKAKVRANREVALLSHVFRWSMNKGLVDIERNPCDDLMYHKETPRKRYVSDTELEAFLAFARVKLPIIAALARLMYLTAQRRVDLLALRLSAILEDGLQVEQTKTGARLLIEWTDELRSAVAEVKAVKRPVHGLTLFCTRDGSPYTEAGIKAMWNRLMKEAIETKVVAESFRMQDLRPKSVSDVGGGKRGKDLAGHSTQATTDRVYDRVTYKRVKPVR